MKTIAFAFAFAALLAAEDHHKITIPAGGTIDASAAARTAPIAKGSSLPGSCTDGDIYDLTSASTGQRLHLCESGTWVKQGAGSSSGYRQEDLFCFGAASTGLVGLGWAHTQVGGGSGGGAFTTGVNGTCGFQVGVTSTTAGHGRVMYSGNNNAWVINPAGATFQKFTWKGRLTVASNIRARLGLASSTGSVPPSKFIGLRADTDTGWADSTFILAVCAGNTDASCLKYNTGVALDTAEHSVELDSISAGTIRMRFDGGAWRTFCASGCDVSGTMPTGDFLPWVGCANASTTATRVDVTYFSYGNGGQ